MLMPKLDYNSVHEKANGATPARTYKSSHKKMKLLSTNMITNLHPQLHQQQAQEQQQQQQQQQHQSHNHVKQLITTAATGTGIVGDVDGMLTPILSQINNSNTINNSGNNSTSPKQRSESRPERNLWSTGEMLEMLHIMQQNNALDKLNDKSIKSDTVFRQVEEIMHASGYRKKSHVQIWTKWKFLKSTYNTTKRSGTIPKMIPTEVYQKLCQMLEGSGVDTTCSGEFGGSSDCGNSMHSLEGEDSNGNLVIAGVKSGYEHHKSTDYEDSGNSLSMAHPIFGFRLGLVKPEPLDTGYEAQGSNYVNDASTKIATGNSTKNNAVTPSFEHTPFEIEVKRELADDSADTPPPTAPASPTPVHMRLPNPTVSNKRQSHFSPPAAITASTPRPGTQLRVAQFAKESRSSQANCGSNSVLKTESLAAPLAIKSATRLNNTSDITFTQPSTKLMLPKLPANAQGHFVRLPKDISVQPARNASLLRLKQVPTRKTPYSLRPERLIPDLEQPMSPPPASVPLQQTMLQYQPHYQEQPYVDYDDGNVATTSRQACISLLKDRKRRLPIDMQAVPIRMQQTSQVPNYQNDVNYTSNLEQDDEQSDSDSLDNLLQDKPCKSGKAGNASQQETFENELLQLATALHQAQREMLHDFYKQQKEFVRREHEFQMKQDILILRAFRKQTNELMQTARNLMGAELNGTATQAVPTKLRMSSKSETDEQTKLLPSTPKSPTPLLPPTLQADESEHPCKQEANSIASTEDTQESCIEPQDTDITSQVYPQTECSETAGEDADEADTLSQATVEDDALRVE